MRSYLIVKDGIVYVDEFVAIKRAGITGSLMALRPPTSGLAGLSLFYYANPLHKVSKFVVIPSPRQPRPHPPPPSPGHVTVDGVAAPGAQR